MNRVKRTNYILAYYQAICDGTAVVGEWIHRIYEYVVTGLHAKTFSYDQKRADDAVSWIEAHCYHTEGELAPGSFKLELWQKALIACMYGILDDKGRRQFREVLLVVARKNGKSILATAIANYELQVYGGFGARVYCIAPKLDQADIVYNNLWTMIQLDPIWQDKDKDDPTKARHRMTDLYLPSTSSTVKKIAFSAKKSDGFNPSFVVCDEIASWPGANGLRQYEVMKSAFGARPDGLLLSVSTSGYENDGIYDELIKRATRFLKGDSKETRLLPLLYMIDDVSKWNDINELQKSNPNLNVSVSPDYLIEEIAIAEGSLSKKAEFITKYCNLKQSSSAAWLDAQVVEKASGEPLHIEDFRSCYCVAGVDLSQTTDLTAACILVERGGELYVFEHFWLPSERLEEAAVRDGLPYGIYAARGLLSPSGENFIDYHDCYKWLTSMVEELELLPLCVGYDRYSAQYLVQDLDAYGFKTDDVYQGDNLYPVLMEMEGLMKDGKVHIGDNDLLKVHLLDSAIKMNNERGRGKLVKLNPKRHIDGVAALADAFCVRQKYYAEIGTQLRNEE